MENNLPSENEKLYAKVYSRFKGSDFFSVVEDGYDYLNGQIDRVLESLKNRDLTSVYSEYYTIEDTLSLLDSFFREVIGEECADAFNKAVKSGNIELYDKYDFEEASVHPVGDEIGPHYRLINEEQFDENGKYLYTNAHKNVENPLEHDIYDVYTLVHEFIHSTNDRYKNMYKSDRELLTESVSITYEFILYDYLKSKGISPNEIGNPIKDRMRHLKRHASNMRYILKMLNKVRTDENLKNIQFDFSNDDEKKAVLDKYADFCDEVKYYIGTLIATVNYKNYIDGKLSLKTLETYNFSIDEYDELDSLPILFETLPTNDEVISDLECLLDSITEGKKL